MDSSDLHDRDATAHALDRELEMLRAGIALVATGAATRVSVGGLRFGEQLLVACGPEAERNGIVLEPRWLPEDAGCDVLVCARAELRAERPGSPGAASAGGPHDRIDDE